MIGVGDYLAVQGIYTQGALRYIFQNPNGNWWLQDGGSAAFGILSDGVFGGSVAGGTATGINLTTAWPYVGFQKIANPNIALRLHDSIRRQLKLGLAETRNN